MTENTEHEHDLEHSETPPEPEQQWTVEEVLDMARRTVRTASICLRADLQGEYDALLSELGTLITPSGELIAGNPEAGLGETSPQARVDQLLERITTVRSKMNAHMWRVQFEAMPADEWDAFVQRHRPKESAGAAEKKAYHDRLIAETAIAPTLTIDQVRRLRGTLSGVAIVELASKALEANGARVGLDVPKLPGFLQMHAELSSED